MKKEPGAPGVRAALSHVGGASRIDGDPALGTALARAFDVGEADAAAARAHVHGFHSYPARMHATTARRLLEALAGPSSVVLDPFCGSGTVLVEARLHGLRAIGTDVNPLAIRLAQLKTRGLPTHERDELLDAARWVQRMTTERRTERAKATQRYEDEDVRLFEPHVLLELDSMRWAIDRVEPPALRDDLELVFSSILTKVSRRRGDSGVYLEARRLAPGFCARMLVSRAEELAEQLQDYARALPPNAPLADVHADDARTLGTLGAASVDVVVSSPPYAATYDYVDHHDVRLRWLRLRIDRFARLELGARRDYARLDPRAAEARWHDELGRALAAIGRVLRPSGRAVLVLGDSAVAGRSLRALPAVTAVCAAAGLRVLAVASQERPHFHRHTRRAFTDESREEHLIALEKAPSGRALETGAQ